MEKASGEPVTAGDPITGEDFAALREELPAHGADSWRQVPWHISLSKAVRTASRENKLLAMVVRSGHPLGCTCNNGLVDRASIIGDPEIGALLAAKFIPVAVDQHIHRRLNNSDGRMFADLVTRSGQFIDAPTQGFYVFTSTGELLSFRHTLEPQVVKQMLTGALEKADARPSTSGWTEEPDDAEFTLNAPPGVVVLDVVSKVLGGYDAPAGKRERILQSSRGRDHCWIRQDEVANLLEGIMPDSLLFRMVRYHLVDNTRGEAPMWHCEQIHGAEAKLRNGRLVGSARLGTAGLRRGYEPSLFGAIDGKDGVLTQFDVVARGLAWGRGYFNSGAPRGRYPMAVRFTLAQGAWPFDGIPPGAARTRADEYLGIPVAAI
ncbi:MAG: hypothetical protein ABI556_09580 [Gemmatimonadales bacterium]